MEEGFLQDLLRASFMVPHGDQLQPYLGHSLDFFLVLHGIQLAASLHQELPATARPEARKGCYSFCCRSWWYHRGLHPDLRHHLRMVLRPSPMGWCSALDQAPLVPDCGFRRQHCSKCLHLWSGQAHWYHRQRTWWCSVRHCLGHLHLLLPHAHRRPVR